MDAKTKLAKLLDDLDLANVDAARICCVSEATVYRWLNGKAAVPMVVLRLLSLMLQLRRAQPLLAVSWSDPDVALQDKLEAIEVTVEVEP